MSDAEDTLIHVEEFLKNFPGGSVVEKAMNAKDSVDELMVALKPLVGVAKKHRGRKSDDTPVFGLDDAYILVSDLKLAQRVYLRTKAGLAAPFDSKNLNPPGQCD